MNHPDRQSLAGAPVTSRARLSPRLSLFGVLAVLLVVGLGSRLRAFVTEGASTRWPANSTIVLSLQLGSHGQGALQDGSANFDVVAQQATSLWNGYLGSNVRFVTLLGGAAAGVQSDNVNNVFFADTYFGSSFGDAIAITGLAGDNSFLDQTDTVFNNAFNWESYRGNLQRVDSITIYDLRRVAIHEFGHTLGLDHPDGAKPRQTVTAIMNSHASNTDVMQADDINGVMSIYGTPAPTPTPTPQISVPALPADQVLGGAVGHVYSSPGDPVGKGLEAMLDAPGGYGTVHHRREIEATTGRTLHRFLFLRNAGVPTDDWIVTIATPVGQTALANGTFTASSTGHGNASSYDLLVSRQNGSAVDATSSLASAQLVVSGVTYAGVNLSSLALDLRLSQSATSAPLFLALQLRFNTPAIPLPSARIVNLSTRVNVGTQSAQAIAGFVFSDPTGTGKQALIRILGRSLTSFGVPGTLGDPVVELRGANGALLSTNDDWANPGFYAPPQAPIFSLCLEPASRTDSILLNRFTGGAFTAVASGFDNGRGPDTGVALVEMYDLEIGSDAIPLNVSTRGQVGTGANVMIAGFVIQGPGTKKVIVRALGPSLTAFGVVGALADPTVSVFNASGTQIATNDNWQTDANSAAVSAKNLAPTNPVESALYLVLGPGSYTAVVRGVSNSTGVALVEVYDAD